MERVDVVADSLIEAGMDTALVARAVRIMRGEEEFSRRFGGAPRGTAEGFVERPGESRPPREGQGEAQGGGEDRQALFDVLRAFRDAGLGGWRGLEYRTYTPSGRRERPVVEPGTYTVAVTIGGETLTQPLRVERAPTTSSRAAAAQRGPERR